MEPLDQQETAILAELRRLAGGSKVIMSWQLQDNEFGAFVIKVLKSNSNYPQSSQAVALAKLRKKGYLAMKKGVYTLLDPQP